MELIVAQRCPQDKTINQVELDPQETLRDIEHLLRRCIECELKKTSHQWWEQRILLEVRRRAEGRMARRERVWPWYPPTSPSVVLLEPLHVRGCHRLGWVGLTVDGCSAASGGPADAPARRRRTTVERSYERSLGIPTHLS